jgi:hypothetical protein
LVVGRDTDVTPEQRQYERCGAKGRFAGTGGSKKILSSLRRKNILVFRNSDLP